MTYPETVSHCCFAPVTRIYHTYFDHGRERSELNRSICTACNGDTEALKLELAMRKLFMELERCQHTLSGVQSAIEALTKSAQSLPATTSSSVENADVPCSDSHPPAWLDTFISSSNTYLYPATLPEAPKTGSMPPWSTDMGPLR